MPSYYSPIKINREKQVIKFIEDIPLDNPCITLDFLKKYVGETDSFTIDTTIDNSTIWGVESYSLLVYKERFETDEEQTIRIDREELYMKNYLIHQEKRKELNNKFGKTKN